MTMAPTLNGRNAQGRFVAGNPGGVVVGWRRSENGEREAFRWTATDGMVGLGDLEGGNFDSRATAVSADGAVIVGQSTTGAPAGGEAFRWTVSQGMVGLGGLPGGNNYSEAFGISSDGTIITGDSATGQGDEAFRWTQADGMVPLGELAGGAYKSNGRGGVSAEQKNVSWNWFLLAVSLREIQMETDSSTTSTSHPSSVF